MPTFSAGLGISRSSYDRIYDEDPYTSISNSTKTGLLFSSEKNKYEFVTGIEIERRSYVPKIIEEVYGSSIGAKTKFSLENIGISTASIPVGLKRKFPITKKLDFYTKVGFGINMVLTTKYDISEEKIVGRASSSFTSASRTITPKLFQKNFDEGALQGGNLLKSIYFSGNLEVGANFKLNEKQSIVTGFGYNRFLLNQGYGPNNDRLDFAFTHIGLRYQLN